MDVRRLRLLALTTGIVLTAAAAVPAGASAAGLIAAYDRYVTGKGFEIGLVNASTGTRLTVPAGVNTTDDELHPSLSVDGRYLVWMRTRLLPKLNGDIPVPADRTLFMRRPADGRDHDDGHGQRGSCRPRVRQSHEPHAHLGREAAQQHLLHPEVPGRQHRQHDRRLHRLPVGLPARPGRPEPRRDARRDGLGPARPTSACPGSAPTRTRARC